MNEDFLKKLHELKRGYIDSLPSVIQEIERLYRNVMHPDFSDTDLFKELYRNVHSLTGSGATYGFLQISNAARELEHFLKAVMEKGECEIPGEQLEKLFQALKASIQLIIEMAGKDDEFELKKSLDEREIIRVENDRILVADDDHFSRARLVAMLEMDGHTVYQAENGKQAIEIFEQEQPGLVILDVIMPVMSGLYAARKIKALCVDHFVPVIFITALEREEDLVDCIRSGGDEFLHKPFSRAILNARIYAMQRIRKLNRELERYRAETEEELNLAKHVFETVINRNPEFPGLETWMQACSHFSGDMFCCNISDNHSRYAMLGDFTGHGLRAAIGILPVSDIFYVMSKKEIALAEIIKEINSKLKSLLPTGQFLCAVFIFIDPESGDIQLCNAGLPPVYALSKDGTELRKLESSGLPLGIVGGSSYNVEVETISAGELDYLFVYTDGLTELRNPEGDMLGSDKLEELLANTGNKSPVEVVKQAAKEFLENGKADDDISVLTIQPVPETE